MNKILLFYDFCKKKCNNDVKCKEDCNKILQQFFSEVKKYNNDNINIFYVN